MSVIHVSIATGRKVICWLPESPRKSFGIMPCQGCLVGKWRAGENPSVPLSCIHNCKMSWEKTMSSSPIGSIQHMLVLWSLPPFLLVAKAVLRKGRGHISEGNLWNWSGGSWEMPLHGPWPIPKAKPGRRAATDHRNDKVPFLLCWKKCKRDRGLKKLSFLLLPGWRHRKQTFRADSHIPGHPMIPHTLSNSQLSAQAAYSENGCGKVENWEVWYVMSCSYTQQGICWWTNVHLSPDGSGEYLAGSLGNPRAID